MSKVTFITNGQKKEVETETGKTILQIALDNDVVMEHACGGNGFCTTCLCKIQEGAENVNERTEREENMGVLEGPDRLGCQTIVEGDVVVEIEE